MGTRYITKMPISIQKRLKRYTIEEKRNRNLDGSFKLISRGTTSPTPSNMYKLLPKNTAKNFRKIQGI